MNIIGRFTLRSMKVNRTWTVVTLVGIILSTAMISAVSTFCESFIIFLRNDTIAQTGNWHAAITGVPAKDIEDIREAGFAGEITVSREVGFALLENPKNEDMPYLFIEQYEESAYKNHSIVLVEGRMPQNEKEIVLPQHLETSGGVKHEIGETLSLSIGKRVDEEGLPLKKFEPYRNGSLDSATRESFLQEKICSYTVTGIIKRPNNVIEPYYSPGYTAIGFLDPNALNPDEQVNVWILAKKLNRSFLDEVPAFAESVGLSRARVSFNNELLNCLGVFGSNGIHNAVYGFAAVFLVIIVVASVTLIHNAFAISISDRVAQLGMLASVGATKQQKLGSVYFEAFALGVIGIPTGILAGILGIGVTLSAVRPLTKNFLTTSLPEGLRLAVSFPSIAAAGVLAATTIFVSAWIPARTASKIMPIDAIKQLGEVKLTSKTVKISTGFRKVFGVEGEIALKNLKRSRKKYRATILSLVISLVLFLTASYFAQEVKTGFSTIETGQNFDICVMYTDTPKAEVSLANEKILAFETVTGGIAIERTDGVFVIGREQLSPLALRYFSPDEGIGSLLSIGSLYALDDMSFDSYTAGLGVDPKDYRDPQNPKMIFVNFGLANLDGKRAAGEILSAEPGQTIEFGLSPQKGMPTANGEKVFLAIGLLTDKRPMGVLIKPFGEFSAVVSKEVFAGLPEHLKSITSQGNPSLQSLFLTTNDAASSENRIFEFASDLSNGLHVYNAADAAQKAKSLSLVVSVFLYGFIALMSLICLANTFNTTTTSVRLRRREMAMLRSVGMTPRSFNRMVRFESIFYGLKALFYGLPISMALSAVLYRISSEAFEFGFSLPWVSYGIAIAAVFVIVGASMFYSTLRIKKENIIDALKIETF